MVPLRLSTTWPSWMNSAGTERIFRSPTRTAAKAWSSIRPWTFVTETSNKRATSGSGNHSPTRFSTLLTDQGCHAAYLVA